MAYRHPKALELVTQWQQWAKSKRFYFPPEPKNILAQFMPSKTGEAPDHELSAEIHAFNLALKAQEDENRVPFLVIYCDLRKVPIKTLAHELGIHRDTFYTRAHKTAEHLVRMTQRLRSENVG